MTDSTAIIRVGVFLGKGGVGGAFIYTSRYMHCIFVMIKRMARQNLPVVVNKYNMIVSLHRISGGDGQRRQ